MRLSLVELLILLALLGLAYGGCVALGLVSHPFENMDNGEAVCAKAAARVTALFPTGTTRARVVEIALANGLDVTEKPDPKRHHRGPAGPNELFVVGLARYRQHTLLRGGRPDGPIQNVRVDGRILFDPRDTVTRAQIDLAGY